MAAALTQLKPELVYEHGLGLISCGSSIMSFPHLTHAGAGRAKETETWSRLQRNGDCGEQKYEMKLIHSEYSRTNDNH